MRAIVQRALVVASIMGLAVAPGARGSGGEGWTELIGAQGLGAWRTPTGVWQVAGDARTDPQQPLRLVGLPGRGVLMNGPAGRTTNLVSRQEFGDLEAHFEFLIPRGSNSGIKFEGLYEIQIADSFGVARPTAHHHGGIYPRAELLPKYHYLDEGVPPRVNASRPPGHWQTLDVIFRAPGFDSAGKKVRPARFDQVVLNGQVIHQDVEVKTPTGHSWRLPERARGPLLLQADHGPVAFRNIRVRPLEDGRGARNPAHGSIQPGLPSRLARTR